MKKLFQVNLKKMIGKKCWAANAGLGTGSMALLHIGNTIKREKPISNKHLSELSRNYHGEFNIHIYCCAWRLSKQNTVVCTWRNSQSEIGKLLRRLVGKRIVDVRINDIYDLRVKFEKGYTLYLFCEQVDAENYYIKTPKGLFTICERSRLSFSKPKPSAWTPV